MVRSDGKELRMTVAEKTDQDTSLHDRWLKEQLKDPEFRTEFEREQREIAAIDAIVNTLEGVRAKLGISKAELARQIGKNPAAVRRLLTAPVNPELRTVVNLADALGYEVRVVPKKPRSRHREAVAA
jgi:DNA-binding phage protein